jgi:hypothetical protein
LILGQLVQDFGTCIRRIDARHPQARNARAGDLFQPGIGSHGEPVVVQLVAIELASRRQGGGHDYHEACVCKSLGLVELGIGIEQATLLQAEYLSHSDEISALTNS